jgi:hypothetical protein
MAAGHPFGIRAARGAMLLSVVGIATLLGVGAIGAVGEADRFDSAPIAMDERRGCCSWHGGVCGCSNGRARCCDGSLSPSCPCD